MLDILNDSDWEEIFENFVNTVQNGENAIHEPLVNIPTITREDVKKVIAISNGQNDEEDWLGVFEVELNANSYYLMVRAWCDYTGWG